MPKLQSLVRSARAKEVNLGRLDDSNNLCDTIHDLLRCGVVANVDANKATDDRFLENWKINKFL